MIEPDDDKATVSALPDVSSTPSDPKKPKLLHINGNDHPKEEGDASPVLAAIPLASDEVEVEAKEEWYHLRMSWSGKIYELKVGANDMYVLSLSQSFEKPFVLTPTLTCLTVDWMGLID